MFLRKADTLKVELAWAGMAPIAQRPPKRLTTAQAASKRDRRSDITLAALGLTLGMICALFPWYILLNPDDFGVRAMRFGGGGNGTLPIVLGAQTGRFGAPSMDYIPPVELDLFSTGTAVKENADKAEGEGEDALAEQPFPPPAISFWVVEIANGRALLEDDTGLFVVQPGSMLPDSSRVETIGDRDGRAVLVTDSGVVLEIEQ